MVMGTAHFSSEIRPILAVFKEQSLNKEALLSRRIALPEYGLDYILR